MRRFFIIAASGTLSMILVLATMQFVCWLLNRLFDLHMQGPLYHVIWLVK